MAGLPVMIFELVPRHGDLTVVFGTVRVFHYNVEDWRASAQAFHKQASRGGPIRRGGRPPSAYLNCLDTRRSLKFIAIACSRTQHFTLRRAGFSSSAAAFFPMLQQPSGGLQ